MRRQPLSVDWAAVESAMRRSVTGMPREPDMALCQRAYRAAPQQYSELHQRVRREEFAAERDKWRLP